MLSPDANLYADRLFRDLRPAAWIRRVGKKQDPGLHNLDNLIPNMKRHTRKIRQLNEFTSSNDQIFGGILM
jgi:hypothetical protein